MTEAHDRAQPKPTRLYDSVLDEDTRTKALAIEGVDDELAILRGRLLYAMQNDATNITRVINCTALILRLVRERYRLTPHDAEELGRYMAGAVEHAARQIDEDSERMKAARDDV